MQNENWRLLSSAPDFGHVICPSSDLDEGQVRCMALQTARGTFPLILARKEGRVVAYVNACTHQFLPLDHMSASVVSADGSKLICSMHQAMYDLMSGEVLAGPAEEPLDAVPVTELGGEIVVGLPPGS